MQNPVRDPESCAAHTSRSLRPDHHRGGLVSAGSPVLVAGLLFFLSMGLGPSSRAQDWESRYLPASDGLFGLRFGMDRERCAEILSTREFRSRRGGSSEQLRFEGKVLGENATVVLRFLAGGLDGGEERLARIEVRWRYDGALRRPRRIFEDFEALFGRRYGPAVVESRGSWAAIESGSDRQLRAFEGVETLATVEIRGVRKDVYRVEVRLEFPPWASRL